MTTAVTLGNGTINSAASLSIDTNGTTPAITISAAQAVAITTSLSFAGTVAILDSTGAAGTVNQVLGTNASGYPTWIPQASGSVTAISITSANGFAGSSSGGATPALTISTSITGVLIGNGTAISAATASDITTLIGTTAVAKATNLAGGATGDLPYQTSANTTAFLTGAAGVLVGAVGAAPSYTTSPAISGASFTGSSVPAAAIVNAGVTQINGTNITIGTTGNTITAATPFALTFGSTLSATAATFDGSAANTVGLNLGSTNTWTAAQTFQNATIPTGYALTIIDDPAAATDAVNKNYVDLIAQGLTPKASVAAGSTVDLGTVIFVVGTPTAGIGDTMTDNNGGFAPLVLDTITPAVGARVLIKNQSPATQNGIYTVTQQGDSAALPWILTRAIDFNSPAQIPSAFTFIAQGSTQADTGWTCITDAPITMDVTPINFVQFSGAGSYSAGSGLTLTGTVFSLKVNNANTWTAQQSFNNNIAFGATSQLIDGAASAGGAGYLLSAGAAGSTTAWLAQSAVTAGKAVELDTATFTIKETASGLSFYNGATIIAQLDASGNLKVIAGVTSYATITP